MAAPLACCFRSKINSFPNFLSSTVSAHLPQNYYLQKRFRRKGLKGQNRRLLYKPDGVHHVPGIPVHPDHKFPSLEELEKTTDEANYPAVIPKFPPGKWGSIDRKNAWMYQSLKEHMLAIPNVKERKHVFLSWKRSTKEHWDDEIKNTPAPHCIVLDPINDHPLALDFRNYVTKTQMIDWKETNIGKEGGGSNPTNKQDSNTIIIPKQEQLIKKITSKVSQDISEFLSFNDRYVQRNAQSQEKANCFNAQSLFRCISESITHHASLEYPHLMTCQYDEDVVVRANWYRVGIEKPEIKDPTKKDEKEEWNYLKKPHEQKGLTPDGLRRPLPEYKSPKEIVEILKKNNNVVYSDMMYSAMIRSDLPLPQIYNDVETEMPSTFQAETMDPPTLPYRVTSYGHKYTPWQIYKVSSAGFTGSRRYQEDIPLDPREFGLVGFIYTGDTTDFEIQYNMKVAQDSRKAMGVTASFTWLAAQAMNQGFSQAVDLTYPLATQTILSDGQTFSFMKYQLNTLELWKDNEASNIVNYCWVTEEEKLYHSIENGQVKELNESVIRRIVEMFITEPKDRGYDMKPTITEKEDRYVVPDLVIEEEVIEEEQYII